MERWKILVNNAGITKGTSEVEKGDEDATQLGKELFSEEMQNWEDVYRTNVIGRAFFYPLSKLLSKVTMF